MIDYELYSYQQRCSLIRVLAAAAKPVKGYIINLPHYIAVSMEMISGLTANSTTGNNATATRGPQSHLVDGGQDIETSGKGHLEWRAYWNTETGKRNGNSHVKSS